MSLRNAKVGDKVVHYPYGIGTIVEDDGYLYVPFKIKHESGVNTWNARNGCYDGCPTQHVWPIDDAPDWVWGALGIEKPKKIVTVVVDVYANLYENGICYGYIEKEEAECSAGHGAVIVAQKLTSEHFEVDADMVDKIPGARVVE